MDERSMRVLEYSRVRTHLCELAVTVMGKEKADELVPMNEFDSIALAQRETTEARRILRGHYGVSLGGIRDIRAIINRVRIGGTPDPSELLDTADTLSAGRKIKALIMNSEEEIHTLQREAEKIGQFQEIENIVYDSVNDLGEITDSASPEISRIRKQMRVLQERIRQKLESYIRSNEYQKIIQEPIVTQREGRFVIPIRQESRGQFPGIIHDQSASGATLFIEPMAVVEINNELRQLLRKEQQEIERILRAISDKIRDRIVQIEESMDVFAYLDFVFAKGKMSQEMDAWEPELSRDPQLDFIQARHPLIGEEVVPIDIRIGQDFNTLVITGPNTGGKTVALKTLGLLVLMAQAGLHIPAKIGSRVGVFKSILADIGDEQSIEQSLSTFSGHMKNIISMMELVDEYTLVLLDEIGAGTDPIEGAALAMAILEHLHAKGARTTATTHYSELKAFAYSKDGVENASVEFDVETLKPTYRLMLGLPGHSNAFAIAQRLGLDKGIIEVARQKVSSDTMKVDDMIRSVAELKAQTAIDQQAAASLKSKAEKLGKDLLDREIQLQEQEREIIIKARLEANSLVAKAKNETEKIIKELRKMQLEKPVTRFDDEFRKIQERFSLLEEEIDMLEPEINDGESLTVAEVNPGMRVLIKKLNQVGEIIQVYERQESADVSIGSLKLNVLVSDLKAAGKEKSQTRKTTKTQVMASESASQIQMDIDLRGLSVAESIEVMEKKLDAAILSGAPRVNIIHGKGTGALREAIRKHLTHHPSISTIRPGESGEGGDGVTIAYIL